MSESKQPKSLTQEEIDVAPEHACDGIPDARVACAAREFSVRHDERSFSILCREAQPRIKGAIAGAGLRKLDVDEVHNNVLFLTWRRRETFSGTYSDFVCFGVGFVANEVMKWRRGHARWIATTVLHRETGAPCVGLDDVEETFDAEQFAAANEAMRSLPARELRVFRGRGDGKTWEEIAAETGLSVVRVRELHASAVRRLAEER